MPSAVFGASPALLLTALSGLIERTEHRVAERRNRGFANPAFAYQPLRVLVVRSIII